MVRILVTGGAGFIGSHVAVVLQAAGYEPVILDDFSNSSPDVLEGLATLLGNKPKFYECNYRDSKKLEKIFADEAIKGIIHFAAFKAVGESVNEPLKYYENNVGGFIELLKLAEKHRLPFVFSSSCTVYGVPEHLPIDETTPWQPPASPYGATKQMGEQILRDATLASNSLKSIALRYFNPIGAHPSAAIGELPLGTPANLIPFLTQTVAGLRDQLTIYGNDYDTPDGTCIRDYIHVMDLAEAHVAALKHLLQQKSGYFDVFNIGTGQGSSVLEVIKTFEKATGQKVPYIVGPRRTGDVPAVYADAAKAKKLLGWQARYGLEQALADAWRWQQKIVQGTV